MRATGWVLFILAACRNETAPQARPEPPPVAPPTPAPRALLPGAFDLATKVPGVFGTGPIGTAHRVLYAEADPAARWALVCQQRTDTNNDGKITYEQEFHFALGDDPSAYLVIGGGAGVKVDEVLATSPTGDHLVVELGDVPTLVDVVAKTGVPLTGASEATFSADGKRVIYFDQRDAAAPKIVRRDLATGATNEHVLPAGSYGSPHADLTGRWVTLGTARVSVRKEAPAFVATEDWMSPYYDWCSIGGRGGVPGYKYDPHVWLWIDLDRGVVLDDQKIIRPAGDHVFTKKGTVVALDGKPIGPTDCKGLEVLGVYEPLPGILVRCARKQGTEFTYLSANGRFTVEQTWAESPDGLPQVLVESQYCFGSTRMCIDLVTGVVAKQTTPEVRSQRSEERALARDGRALVGASYPMGPLEWKPRAP